MTNKNARQFGGSGLDKEVYDWIRFRLPAGSTILELGSGDVSTRQLSAFYTMWSVEEDEAFVGRHASTYIHAPIEDSWYATAPIIAGLPAQYDLLLVDGPCKTARRLCMLDNLDLFDWRVPWVFHDMNFPPVEELIMKAARATGKAMQLYREYPFFGVLL